MKRTYKNVSVAEGADGFTVLLDEALAHTPLATPLLFPTRALAQAVAQEWVAQEKTIRINSMPLTQIACVGADLVALKRDEITQELLAYAETDLVCYRAGTIPELEKIQEDSLSPVIAWAEEKYGIHLKVTSALMPVTQVPQNKIELYAALAGYDDFKLAVLAVTVKPLGSLVLALALVEGRIDVPEAFRLGHLEEIYETQQWGEDEEKEAKMKKIQQEIQAAGTFLSLLNKRVSSEKPH